MVKKIKYIFPFFIFFLSINVKAYNLDYPTSYYYDTSSDTPYYVNTSLDLWWGTNQTTDYYYHSSRIGDFGGATTPRIYRVDYNFTNANLCSGQDLSLSGLLGGPGNFFDEQSWEVQIWSNGSPLACSFTRIAGNKIEYKCYGKGGGNLNYYFWERSFTTNSNYMVGVNRNITYTCDVSNASIVEQSIINSQNIINNQNSTTNQIIQDNQQNTQEIIDNQNSNTEKEIESQKVCKWNLKEYNKSIVNGNVLYFNNATSGTDMVFEKGKYKFVFDYSKQNNGNLYLRVSSSNTNLNVGHLSPYVIEQNESFNLWFWTNLTINSSFVESVKIYKWECINGNQGVNDSINDLNDTLNDTSQPNTNSDINDMNDMVASDTPISDLITMPLTLINAYINGVNSSCSPVNLGNLYGTDLILPCINLEQKLGSNLWHIIDSFFTIFMCYNIGMLFITAFDGITSLRDDFEGLYQPRHADTGYQPKHGG